MPQDYMDFLIATPKACSAWRLPVSSRFSPKRPAANDAFTRLLRRLEPDPENLWLEACLLGQQGRRGAGPR